MIASNSQESWSLWSAIGYRSGPIDNALSIFVDSFVHGITPVCEVITLQEKATNVVRANLGECAAAMPSKADIGLV